MIGKISMGKSFRGCISYCLEDKKLEQSEQIAFKNRAVLVAFNHCFGNKNELIEQFNDVRTLNQKVQKPVLHITLSLAPEDRLDKEKLVEMAGQCAKEMGFENNQYIAVSHIDTQHQHLHIVANRVGYDSKVVSDSQNYKKIAAYCRNMELQYNLKQVLSPRRYLAPEQRNIPRMDARKEKLRGHIHECLSASKSFSEFESKIKLKVYKLIKGRGISFTDKQAVKVKGSEVGYSLQKIEKVLELQQQLHQLREDKVRHEQNRQQQKQFLNQHSWKEEYGFMQKESFLTETIKILLKPETHEAHIPEQFLRQNNIKKKKKLRQHL